MQQYIDLVKRILRDGERRSNRTGMDTIQVLGNYMVFEMAHGFPLLTTKRVNWKSCFAEMLGFLRGYDSAAQFRELGTNVWDANANTNEEWLANPVRKREDDLGRIYGVQARRWAAGRSKPVDQLRKVYDDLRAREDDRREIITHWNPGEMDLMALPPCHLLYQFGFEHEGFHLNDLLSLFVYIRSNDVGLGMPFNIAGYAWLLEVMARITESVPWRLHYFSWNTHIYVDHIEPLKQQIEREPRRLPRLVIPPWIKTLEDLEEGPMPQFLMDDYDPHPAIKMKMAV